MHSNIPRDTGEGMNESKGHHRARAGMADGQLVADMAKGAIAGALGVWVMDRVDWFMYEHEDPGARRRTQHARPGGLDPAHVVADKIASAAGADLSPSQRHPAGMGIHYSLGIGPGAIYGALRDRVPYMGAGRGTLWGFALFALQDEVLNSAAGLSGKPRDYPWQAHARGLLAHLVYGAVTDIAFSVMKERAAASSSRPGRGPVPASPDRHGQNLRQSDYRRYGSSAANARD